MGIFIGILLIIAGLIAEVYAFSIVRIFGHLGWAERRFGPGGSYTAWRLIGIICIVGGYFLIRYGADYGL